MGAVIEAVTALALFAIGVVLAVWATERLLEGLVELSRLTLLSPFAVGAALSGFEAENVAVGLAAAVGGQAPIALGTVFGGATFLIGIALGLGAILYPMRVRLPTGFLVVTGLSPLLPGLLLLLPRASRLAGLLLLVAFAAGLGYLIVASHGQTFLESEEIREALEEKRPGWPRALGITVLGLVAVGIGGELVATGADRLIAVLGIPALLMGMVVTPAAIELEEVIRQAVPTRAGHPEVSAGNLIGTLLYFVLFNLGLIALLAPVEISPRIWTVDWPSLVGMTWLAVLFLARGRVGRREGMVLVGCYGLYVVGQLVLK